MGDCYEAAANYIIERAVFDPDSKLKLEHGEVMGQGPLEGTQFGHAWVLDGRTVIDPSNGKMLKMPKDAYYRMGRIDEIGNVHTYTWKQAKRKLVDRKTYGPWDLETSTGL
jgi:hypothetical protein